MNEPIQPEELTDLQDDDLEMWAQGGTRIMTRQRHEGILPKSPLERPKPASIPPVAFPSIPPPQEVIATTSSAPMWAALIGMAAVFFLAAVGGGIFYALHRASASATPTEVAAVTTSAPEPQQVTLTTDQPVAITTATATSTPTATPKVASIAAPPVRYATIQTFAAGNGKPVFIDGRAIGTGGTRIKAVCGKHSVSVGTGKAKTVDIPCNNTSPFTVGTPDGA